MKNAKTIKTVLFAAIMLSMVIPITSMSMAEAILDDKERLAIKKQKIAENFQSFLDVRQQADNLEKELDAVERQIEDLNGATGSDMNSLAATKDSLTAKLNTLYQEIDKLQEESYTLHKIPEQKQAKLEKTMDKILQKHEKLSKNHNSAIEDVFIDAVEEKVVVMKNNKFDASDNAMKQKVASMEVDVKSLAQTEGVEITVSELVLQSHTTTGSSPCNNDSERDDYCQPAAGGVQIKAANSYPGYVGTYETSTLSFPAHRLGVSGFVMIGHGVIGNGNNGEDVYQPAYPYKIGDIVVNYYDQNNQQYGCDCAFVSLSPGRTVANEVVYNGLLLDITGYTNRASQPVGQYVLQSGIVYPYNSFGQVVSLYNSDSDWVYASYTGQIGDSGAPVGKVLSGTINIYGMHKGNSPNGQYSAYVPYDTIKSYLSLS